MKNSLLFVLTTLFVVTSNYYFLDSPANQFLEFSSHSIWNIFFIFIIYNFFKYAFSFSLEKRINLWTLTFSIFFTIILQVGKSIYYTDTIIKFFNSGIFITITQSISFCMFFFASLRVLYNHVYINSGEKQLKLINKTPNKYFNVITFTLIFTSFFLAFLSYFPGILSYDSLREITLENYYSRLDPPIYCYYITSIVRLGFFLQIEPIIIYGILQMLFLSYVMTRTTYFLKTNLVNGNLILICFLMIILTPTIAIFSIIPAKEPFLACFLQLLIINIMQNLKKPSILRNNILKQCIIIFQITLCCLLRNNVIFAIIPTFFYIFLNRYYKLATLFFISICLYFFVQYPIYDYFNIKDGSISESMSVPLNQWANIVVNDEYKLTPKEKDAIDTFIPYSKIKQDFNPRFSDPIKSNFKENNFLLNKKLFFITYFKLFFKFPVRYIDAFLNLCLPYWYFDASSIDKYSNRMYIETQIWNNTEYHFERKSYIPVLLKIYESFANLDYVKKVPVLYFIFSLSTPFFLILISSFILIVTKRFDLLIINFLYLTLLTTYFLGPVSNFRYIFPFVCAYPIFILFIFGSKNINKLKNF